MSSMFVQYNKLITIILLYYYYYKLIVNFNNLATLIKLIFV